MLFLLIAVIDYTTTPSIDTFRLNLTHYLNETKTYFRCIKEAQDFCTTQSTFKHKELFGVTGGKAVGTLIEAAFQQHLNEKYEVTIGNAASGIDLPSADIITDIKVTSIKQPQSSCPFKDAKQKIYGLGYNLLVFVYDKKDDQETKTSTLNFVSCSFVSKERTGDYTTTATFKQIQN